MDAMALVVQLQDLANRLEGATALNIFLVHKLGGQLTIDKDEFTQINLEFSELGYSANGETMTIKLASSPAEKAVNQ